MTQHQRRMPREVISFIGAAVASIAFIAAAPVPPGPIDVEMKNVHLRMDDGIALDITYLRGQMVSRTPGQTPVFDDAQSYILRVAFGEVSMDMPSVEALLNQRIFTGPDSPMTEIHVSVSSDGKLQQSAKLHKGVSIPVSMKSTVSASPDGRLQLHVDSYKAIGIPAGGFLSIFGVKAGDMVNLKNRPGVEAAGNDIFISPGLVVPPPEIQGKLATVALQGDHLVQTFARDPALASVAPLHPPVAAKSYLYFAGGVLRFGRLTMTGVDMELLDVDQAATSLDFFPREYLKQLVAGYSKTTPTGGLIAYVKDYGALAK
jgi:hypothetical protein